MVSHQDKVYAKHKNGRYYVGEVVDIKAVLYYCVIFDDNSTSQDLFPEDVVVSESLDSFLYSCSYHT